jgi:hypothetical protein
MRRFEPSSFEPPENSSYIPMKTKPMKTNKTSRHNPYKTQPISPLINRGILNQEKLIEAFYTNVYNSIIKELTQLKTKFEDLFEDLQDQPKLDLRELSDITVSKIDEIIRGDTDINLKKTLLLLIIIIKLKELIIEPDILDEKLRTKRTNMSERKYLEYLRKFFDNIAKPYKNMLNIRNGYTENGSLDDIDYLQRYSKFLVGYVKYAKYDRNTAIDARIPPELFEYLNTNENLFNPKLNRNFYKQYYTTTHSEHSGGRRDIKSNRVMKDIKELCKANQIKLSRIIDGKRVVYKKNELITKLKRKKIKIATSLH